VRPDLIAVVDSITAEALKCGQRIAVLGISAAPIMRSPEALAVWGPKAFGLTQPYIPVEQLNPEAASETRLAER